MANVDLERHNRLSGAAMAGKAGDCSCYPQAAMQEARKTNWIGSALPLLTALFVASVPVNAQVGTARQVVLNPNPATRNAFQMWTPAYMDWPLLFTAHKKLRGYLEVNPRLNENLDGMSQLLVRPAIGYRLNRHVGGYVGYTWVANYPGSFFQEQRIWEQLGVGFVLFKRIQVLNRFRLEQRMIQHTHRHLSWRGRYMLRAAMPLFDTRWYLVGFDELFVNFNSVPNGPNHGIDQNRVFGGLGRQINTHLRIETGYQLQRICRRDPTPDQNNHVLLTNIFVDF